MDENLKTLLAQIAPYDRMRVSPVSGGSAQAYYAKYIGHIDQTAILASRPKRENDTLEVMQGQELDVRVLLQDGVFMFQSSVLQIINVSGGYLHLGMPESVQLHNIRVWPRVAVREHVSVVGELVSADGTETTQAIMTNIGLGGAMIEAGARLGPTGGRITFTCSVTVGTFQRELEIPCTIRQVRIHEDKATGVVLCLHGVEFDLDEETEKIFLHGYVLEQLYFAKTRKHSLSC